MLLSFEVVLFTTFGSDDDGGGESFVKLDEIEFNDWLESSDIA